MTHVIRVLVLAAAMVGFGLLAIKTVKIRDRSSYERIVNELGRVPARTTTTPVKDSPAANRR